MTRPVAILVALIALALAGTTLAQVATAEVQGIDTTAPHSRGVSGWLRDDSPGEVVIVVRALDAAGNPVAGAEVQWTVRNRADGVVYVVGTSESMATMLVSAYNGVDQPVAGGVTDANGEAYIVVDSLTRGDTRVLVSVGGVAGKTYDGGDMRVVWF